MIVSLSVLRCVCVPMYVLWGSRDVRLAFLAL